MGLTGVLKVFLVSMRSVEAATNVSTELVWITMHLADRMFSEYSLHPLSINSKI